MCRIGRLAFVGERLQTIHVSIYYIGCLYLCVLCVCKREGGGGGLQRIPKLLHFIFQRVIFKSVVVGGFWGWGTSTIRSSSKEWFLFMCKYLEGAGFPSLKLLLQHTHDDALLTHKVPLLLLKLNHSPLKFCKIFVPDTLFIHKVPPLLLKLNHSRLKFYEIFMPDED